MATITGTVRCIQIGDGYGFTTIADASNQTEVFILWFSTTVSVREQITHNNWVALLREAFAGNLQVRVTSPTNSAYVSLVQLGSTT